jgi:hypothetical protein
MHLHVLHIPPHADDSAILIRLTVHRLASLQRLRGDVIESLPVPSEMVVVSDGVTSFP